MKKLFAMYQDQTFGFLMLFFFGIMLPNEVQEHLGPLAGLILIVLLFLVSILTVLLSVWWATSKWKVRRPWAMISIGFASALSSTMIGTAFASFLVDVSWMIAHLREVYFPVALLSLAAYGLDRILYSREAAH